MVLDIRQKRGKHTRCFWMSSDRTASTFTWSSGPPPAWWLRTAWVRWWMPTRSWSWTRRPWWWETIPIEKLGGGLNNGLKFSDIDLRYKRDSSEAKTRIPKLWFWWKAWFHCCYVAQFDAVSNCTARVASQNRGSMRQGSWCKSLLVFLILRHFITFHSATVGSSKAIGKQLSNSKSLILIPWWSLMSCVLNPSIPRFLSHLLMPDVPGADEEKGRHLCEAGARQKPRPGPWPPAMKNASFASGCCMSTTKHRSQLVTFRRFKGRYELLFPGDIWRNIFLRWLHQQLVDQQATTDLFRWAQHQLMTWQANRRRGETYSPKKIM